MNNVRVRKCQMTNFTFVVSSRHLIPSGNFQCTQFTMCANVEFDILLLADSDCFFFLFCFGAGDSLHRKWIQTFKFQMWLNWKLWTIVDEIPIRLATADLPKTVSNSKSHLNRCCQPPHMWLHFSVKEGYRVFLNFRWKLNSHRVMLRYLRFA